MGCSPHPKGTEASALTPSPVTYKLQPTKGQVNPKNSKRSEQVNAEELKSVLKRNGPHPHPGKAPCPWCPSLTPPLCQLGHLERRVQPISTHIELGHGTRELNQGTGMKKKTRWWLGSWGQR